MRLSRRGERIKYVLLWFGLPLDEEIWFALHIPWYVSVDTFLALAFSDISDSSFVCSSRSF